MIPNIIESQKSVLEFDFLLGILFIKNVEIDNIFISRDFRKFDLLLFIDKYKLRYMIFLI